MRALAEQAARAAGQIIREAHGAREIRYKGAIDLVTEVDLASEAAIRAILEAATPGVPVLAEEGGGALASSERWIVDPLDGTTNFVHGFPSYAVSIALEVAGEIVAGCIYDPIHDAAYTAAKGEGATCNGAPIHVSDTDVLDRALLITGFAYDRRERTDFYLAFVRAFLKRSQGLRRAGSAAMDLCHIAAGRADGYWEFNLQPWDVAAGVLLVAEAGGAVSDVLLGPLDINRPRLLATNGRIHDEMSEIIAPLLSSP